MNVNNIPSSYGDPADQYEDDDDQDDTERAVERTRDGFQPISAFEVSPRETASLLAQLTSKAARAKEQQKTLEVKEKDLLEGIQSLTKQLVLDRREFAVATKLARVRKTEPEILSAMEEGVATLEVEVEGLEDELNLVQTQLVDTRRTLNQAKLTIDPLGHAEFNLGTTKPLLTLQLVSGLRRNLVYRQNYLETRVDALQAQIARQLELKNYSHGIAGFESKHERDRDRMEELEDELGEVYAMLETTGLVYDKVMDLLSEQQLQMIQYWPRDAVSIEQIRRDAAEKQAEKEAIAIEIAERRAAATRRR